MKKTYKLLLILCLTMFLFVGCEDKVRPKEETDKEQTTKEEVATEDNNEDNNEDKDISDLFYNEKKALQYDEMSCTTVKSCFNAALCCEDAFQEAGKKSGEIIITFEDDNLVFVSNGDYPTIEVELESSLADLMAPKEKGKVAYQVTWKSEDRTISSIKVVTIDEETLKNARDDSDINDSNDDANDNQIKPTAPPNNELKAPEQYENEVDAKEVELKVWAPAEEQVILKDLCYMFDGAHPEYDITFTFEECAESDTYTRISKNKEMAADVFYFANDQLPYLVEDKCVLPVSLYVQEKAEEELDEGAVNACKMDGNMYSLPFTANLWYLFYNKAMFTEDEVKSLDVMIKKDITGCDYNFAMPLNNGWYLGGFFLGGGCTLFGENGIDPTQCDWASDRGVGIVNYLNGLVATGKFFNDNGSAEAIGLLAEGRCASFATGGWNALKIKEALGDNYGAARLPMFTYEMNGELISKDITPFADYKSIGIKYDTKYPVEALMLTEFLTSAYAQEVRLKARLIAPTHKDIIENIKKYNEPSVKANVEQMSVVVERPRITQMNYYWHAAAKIGLCVVEKNDYVVSGDEKILELLEIVVDEIVK